MTSNAISIGGEAYLFPASFAQQRLWFLDQLTPNHSFYNVSTAVRLQGGLNLAALEQTFNEIVWRHEALRTRFCAVGGQPMQAIAPWQRGEVALPLVTVDLRRLSAAQRSRQVEQQMQAAAQQPFCLATELLMRTKLLRLSDTEHVLLLTLHHIIVDGWSIALLLREVSVLYRAFVEQQPSPLPPLPIQYADYAQWQRDWLQGDIFQTQLAYWQQQLADLPLLALPSDASPSSTPTYQGATACFELSRSLTRALADLSQQAEVTLFITLLAAFQVLLYRYSGQDDIAVGTPIANRNRQEIEGLIGFFVNTLVLRTDLSGRPTFRQLLDRVRATALDAYAHQDLPFERLVEELQPDRLSRSPLVRVMFALQSAPPPQLDLPGLTAEFLEVETPVAKFDLTLSFEQTPQGLEGSLEYSTDLFDAQAIARLIAHLQTLLSSIAADPDQAIDCLPLLSAAERQRAWCQQLDPAAEPLEDGLLDRIAAQAARTPNAIALVSPTQRLTYADLMQRVDRLARRLQQLGVQPETLVGLKFSRSPALVVAMLAVLRAGGAYLPIDPDAPAHRQQAIATDAQAAIVLTPQDTDDLPEVEVAQAAVLQPRTPAPDRLAYVIYTSGSTGQPKGVEVEHRGLLNLVDWHLRQFGITAADRASQIAAPAFDAFGWEVFPYLVAGASVYFADEDARRSPVQLRDWLVQQQITVSFVPTPLAERLLTLDWSATALRWLLVGGDRLHRYPPAGLPFAVVNNYGPTEATVIATAGVVPAGSEGVPPIGHPIDRTQIHLLDAHRQPVPLGACGEIYISGAGVARGYRRQPDLTAERFLTIEGMRLYKTGDRARYRADGSLEFLGRTDDQVKIRGFRVEPAELEAAIAQHPAIQAAAAVAVAVESDWQLVAYVTRRADCDLTNLLAFLQTRLPAYLLPARVIELDHLPLTRNGKLDRRALPALTVGDAIAFETVPPRTPLESVLLELWADVLGHRSISVEASFFTVGGHSLLATQLVSRLRDVLHIELPLPVLFESPTIAALAAYIDTLHWAAEHPAAPSEDREEVEF